MSTRSSVESPFGEAERLTEPVNVPGSWTTAPVLSDDGLTLLATTSRPGLDQSGDIVQFTRGSCSEPFGKMVRLPGGGNVAGYEIANWISANGRVLLTTTMIGMARHDNRFHVRLSVDQDFGPGLSLGELSESFVLGRPWISQDGQRMYFHSREIPGGEGGDLDLWMSERRPKTK